MTVFEYRRAAVAVDELCRRYRIPNSYRLPEDLTLEERAAETLVRLRRGNKGVARAAVKIDGAIVELTLILNLRNLEPPQCGFVIVPAPSPIFSREQAEAARAKLARALRKPVSIQFPGESGPLNPVSATVHVKAAPRGSGRPRAARVAKPLNSWPCHGLYELFWDVEWISGDDLEDPAPADQSIFFLHGIHVVLAGNLPKHFAFFAPSPSDQVEAWRRTLEVFKTYPGTIWHFGDAEPGIFRALTDLYGNDGLANLLDRMVDAKALIENHFSVNLTGCDLLSHERYCGYHRPVLKIHGRDLPGSYGRLLDGAGHSADIEALTKQKNFYDCAGLAHVVAFYRRLWEAAPVPA